MERHYQDALHPRDLMFVTSYARYGHGRSSSSVNSNVSSKMFNETQKTLIELCKKAKTPGSTDVDL
eukprot:2338499-Ditylum_brightwellii.AAC.1